MSHFFSSSDAALRYDTFRPAVHPLALKWLTDCGLPGPYKRAIDVACGTGQSTVPLLQIAAEVQAVDRSGDMVAVARRQGLDATILGYESLRPGYYDLITVCMAFHWFERDLAVRSFRAASAEHAIWLIYNFWLSGHATDRRFNEWYRGWYRETFPSPPRGATQFVPGPEERGIELVASAQGALEVSFQRDALIGYLTTQSNVEAHALRAGSYAPAEESLRTTLPHVEEPNRFLYGFTYSICKAAGA